MSVGVRQLEPAPGPVALAAGRGGARPRKSRLRILTVALGSAASVLAVVLVAGGLAAARVPQHRAALEDLIRHETGLDVSFRELTVRWGWYGPEAVFHAVSFRESARGGSLLRAPQLVVGLDLWRMVRSGHLEAGRITLVSPDIDLGPGGLGARAAAAAGDRAAVPEDVLPAGARVLSRWRGGRIDVEGGTLRVPLPAGAPAVTFTVRHAQLRRLEDQWSADALLLLPGSLGASARIALELTGDPAQLQLASGTLSFDGRRLQFGGWRALAAGTALARYLPLSGYGNLELHAMFGRGGVLGAQGAIRADALAWSAPAAPALALTLARLRGQWQLARIGSEWHFTADSLELAEPSSPAASLSVVADANGDYARGRAQQLPVAALAAAASWYLPQLPLAAADLGGVARELSFDWSARRPAELRLQTAATIEELSLGTAVRLSGLSAHVSSVGERLVADLTAQGAQLAIARTDPLLLGELEVAARLALQAGGGGWQLSADDVEIRRAELSLAASGALTAANPAMPPRVSAHVALKDADAALLAQILGPETLAALGAAASHLSAGRIESADFELHGPLSAAAPWSTHGSTFSGALTLRAGRVTAGELWPEAQDLDARIDWQGARVHAAVDRGRSGTFELATGSADWDARGEHPTHLAGRLTGSTQQALAWLREHPQLAPWIKGAQDLDVRGDTLLDFDLTLPAAAAAAARRAPRVRVTAVLDGAQLRPLAGLPPIEALHGTLAFVAGHLQRSTLSGQWLGGPASLAVAEHRERDATAVAITGHGALGVRQALLAAGGPDDGQLAGSAEWSALVTLLPGAAGWRVRADSNLAGVASTLPEPFAKPAGALLPLHVELQGAADHGELQVILGDRLRALAALARSGEFWRIERGAVRLDAVPPALPGEPLLALEGRVRRLDLPTFFALWLEAGRDAALPALRASLSAAQLLAGARAYTEVNVAADEVRGAGELQVKSAELSGTLRWPARSSTTKPAQVYLASFDLTEPGDAALAAALAGLLAPATRLAIDDLRWQGHSLGHLDAALEASGGALDVTELHLAGPGGETRAAVHCEHGACRAQLSLDSRDAAASLATFGLRPDLAAGRATLAGQLEWSAQVPQPLASLGGHLHMQLQDGLARATDGGSGAPPFALLSVPALMAGLSADTRDAAEQGLHFSGLSADFELRQGEATTANLHFDGDAEIWVRGRVGLVERDYDEQAWILRGEERLPAAVRRLGPTPRVAALWLSLRELFAGWGAERSRTGLRLRGTWSDPIVTPAQ